MSYMILRASMNLDKPSWKELVAAVYSLRLRAIALALRGPPDDVTFRIVGGHRPPLQCLRLVL